MKLICCALLLVTIFVSGCRHVAPIPRAEEPRMKVSSVKGASVRRVQHVCEAEILALPKGTFMNFDQDFRAEVISGQPLNAAVPARFLTHRDVRILMRPRLVILDGDSGIVRESDTITSGTWVELAPVSRPDGSVMLHAEMRIPAMDKRGHVILKSDKTPEMNLIAEDRIVRASTDYYQCYRPDATAGAYDVFVFLKLQTIRRN